MPIAHADNARAAMHFARLIPRAPCLASVGLRLAPPVAVWASPGKQSG